MDRFTYRGKRVDNGEWVYGNVCYSPDFPITIFGLTEKGRYGVEVDPATIGQCTGVKDKSGNLIYEGDILKKNDWSTDSRDVFNAVVWYEIGWHMKENGYELDVNETVLLGSEDWQIVGNIHENPELITSQNTLD